ncbi:MAG: cytochrome P450 [Proteobacteria bacterium]|nr:cytochrome P450 [Pseudomonadota bacterium]
MIAPKPEPRPDRVSLWQYLKLFRRDILSAQPARLYRAWMAEFRTPFFRSYLCNDPALIEEVLTRRPGDFPKSDRVREGLAPLLGQSVFVTNGALWLAQRRIIDPAFAKGRLHETYPALLAAAEAARDRLLAKAGAVVEIEEFASHAAADAIFRTLFSIPIEHETAARVFAEFRAYQRAQPLLNLAAFLPLPAWMPRFLPRRAKAAAATIRALIAGLVEDRLAAIKAGRAPDDLATKIMTTPDPETGRLFTTGEMVDQVAIFFLAGHETSAAALGWALYLLARDTGAQDRAAAEAAGFAPDGGIAALGRMGFIRDVFRETLRLYPPVPMMVREATRAERFRDRDIGPGAQIVLSPWHLHRHERLWNDPDSFDPDRWQREAGRKSARSAYMPFSEGPRVCPGAGFAMIEGPLFLAILLKTFEFRVVDAAEPVPVAQLTVRAKDGIRLIARLRDVA